MLGGLAAGLGLAWLANALGFGPAMANFLTVLLIAFAVMALIAFIRRSRANANGNTSGQLAYQGNAAGYNPRNVGNDASARPWEQNNAQFTGFDNAPAASGASAGGSIIGSALAGPQGWGIPEGFDVAGFIDAAKRNFVSLQAAWDRGDIPALRAMMTDDMLAEIQQQLADRQREAPSAVNRTEVHMLDAQLLGIEETASDYLASVEFSGAIQEEADAGPRPFREVWNMNKPMSGRGGWLVAGIQALE